VADKPVRRSEVVSLSGPLGSHGGPLTIPTTTEPFELITVEIEEVIKQLREQEAAGAVAAITIT
jgi:hypothetical protein